MPVMGIPQAGTINEKFADEGWDLADYTYAWGYEGIKIRFYKDGAVQILWFLDYVPGPKNHGSGWIIRNRYVQTIADPFPEGGFPLNVPIPININGSFWVQHDGIGIETYDPTNYREQFNFNITSTIERIQ